MATTLSSSERSNGLAPDQRKANGRRRTLTGSSLPGTPLSHSQPLTVGYTPLPEGLGMEACGETLIGSPGGRGWLPQQGDLNMTGKKTKYDSWASDSGMDKAQVKITKPEGRRSAAITKASSGLALECKVALQNKQDAVQIASKRKV
eukprot:superscaffoldBa00001569_g11130